MSGHHFAESPVASLTHPVWEKKRNEQRKIINTYQLSRGIQRKTACLNRIRAFFSLVTYRSFFETAIYRGKFCKDFPLGN
jgi:hypothetical protein